MSAAVDLKAKEPEYKPHTKLSGVTFVESVNFGGEQLSFSVGRNVDSIVPARLEKDGSAVAVDSNQRADGILMRKKSRNLATNECALLQCFIPFANIRAMSYGA